MKPTPQMLNDALCAYICTIPNRDSLKVHISENGLEAFSQEITAVLNSLVKTAEDYLYNFPGGVPRTDTFHPEYLAYLQQSHPWLDNRGANSIFSFSGWLCWHEGLHDPVTKL